MSDYKLVPVEPTAEMVEAAREQHEGDAYLPVSLYKAMLATAPQPAVQGEPSRESLMVVLERDEYGKPAVWCDPEIADLVSALNRAGVRTIASCSGHGRRPGNIVLADGRELVVARNFEESRIVDSIFQGINGEPARAVVVPKTAVQGEPVFMWHRGATDDESEVVDVDCACPCCVPLYLAPQPAPDVVELVRAMEDAAQSLETISTGAGRGEFMEGIPDIRGYARSRAMVARKALAAHRKQGGDV